MADKTGGQNSGGSKSTGGPHGDSAPTSGSREESMDAGGEDAFAVGAGLREPRPDDQGDGTSDDLDETPSEDQSKQNPASSGTTSIGGEPRDGDSIRSPGGIEGTG